MRKPWLQSLRARFFLAFALVALLGIGTVALVANQVTTHQFALYISRGGQMRAQRWAQIVAESYAQTGSWQGVEDLFEGVSPSSMPGQGRGRGQGQLRQGLSSTDDERFLIVDIEGRVVVDTEDELIGQPLDADALEHGTPIVVDGRQVGTLLITTPDLSGHTELERRFLEAVRRAVLWAMLLVAAASLIAAALLSRQLVAPLRQLTSAAEAMADGDLSQRVQVRSRDQIGELAHAFNAMAGDLQAAEIQRRQMTADIAHELRNPLSVIRGNLEAMLDQVYPLDVEHLAPVYEETVLLQRLVEDLRLLSLADAGQLQLVRSDVNVTKLLSGIADSVQAIAQDKGISLRVDTAEASLGVDADRLRQIIGNLVNNALRYTPEGGTVTLRARADGGQVCLAVSDSGQGISSTDLPHIFDRFYRADSARDRTSGGSGLGLAIVRALVKAHGGSVDVQSDEGQGTTFTVWLPRASGQSVS
jgi:signal transduction histidine kinase